MNYNERRALEIRRNIRFAIAKALPETLRIVRPNIIEKQEERAAMRKLAGLQSCSQIYGR